MPSATPAAAGIALMSYRRTHSIWVQPPLPSGRIIAGGCTASPRQVPRHAHSVAAPASPRPSRWLWTLPPGQAGGPDPASNVASATYFLLS